VAVSERAQRRRMGGVFKVRGVCPRLPRPPGGGLAMVCMCPLRGRQAVAVSERAERRRMGSLQGTRCRPGIATTGCRRSRNGVHVPTAEVCRGGWQSRNGRSGGVWGSLQGTRRLPRDARRPFGRLRTVSRWGRDKRMRPRVRPHSRRCVEGRTLGVRLALVRLGRILDAVLALARRRL
jgi:hypothetical protein